MQIFIKSTKHFSFLFFFSFLTKLLVQVMIMTATILFVYSVIEAFSFQSKFFFLKFFLVCRHIMKKYQEQRRILLSGQQRLYKSFHIPFFFFLFISSTLSLSLFFIDQILLVKRFFLPFSLELSVLSSRTCQLLHSTIDLLSITYHNIFDEPLLNNNNSDFELLFLH